MNRELTTEVGMMKSLVENTSTSMHMEGWPAAAAFTVMCASVTILGVYGMSLYERIIENENSKAKAQ